jgi:hypothetical protein
MQRGASSQLANQSIHHQRKLEACATFFNFEGELREPK